MNPSARVPFPRWFVSCAALLSWSCTGSIHDATETPGVVNNNSPQVPSGPNGINNGPMIPGQTGAPSLPGALPPDNGVPPGPSAAPLRRLTTREYHNTVRDLFRGADIPAQSFPPPVAVNGFENHELSLPATSILTESELDAAAAIAERVVAQRDKWVKCTGQDVACARDTADALLARAYRRPPTTAERDRIRAFVDETFEASDFASTLSDVVQVVLVSPQFLYRIETGKAPAAAAMWVDLDDYELASRLSYFLWETMPDDALFEDAAAGQLSNPATLKMHADRMLNDPRARDVVAEFHRQWLDLKRLDTLRLDPTMFPELDDALKRSLRGSLEQFVAWAFWDQHSMAALFGADRVFADGEIAGLLSLPGAGSGANFTPAMAPNRKGLLTQPGLLASTSHGTLHSPVLRGVQILRRFLCVNIPAPPPGVTTTLEPLPENAARTTRQHFEMTHRKTDCASCHDMIDSAGFALENFDALGRFVTKENGIDIDARGSLPVGANGATVVNGGAQLSEVLASSQEVRTCLANQWFRFAFGREPSQPSDLSEIRLLAESVSQGEGDPRALLLAIVDSTSFHKRPIAN